MTDETLPDYMRGFSGEDADWGFQVTADRPADVPTIIAETGITDIKSDVKMIKSQMAEIMQIAEQQRQAANVTVSADVKARFAQLEKIIIPFLYKLSQGEEEYIRWPNRAPIINAQIEKILKLTRGT